MDEAVIMNWNIRGMRNNKNDLLKIISDRDIQIITLQETKIKEKKEFIEKRRYVTFSKEVVDQGNSKGGVAIMVKKNIPTQEIKINSQMQAIAVRIALNISFTICTMYITEENWRNNIEIEIERIIKELPKPIILTGDFNAHNKIWYDKKTDTKGERLLKVIESTDLIILDKKEPTYWSPAYNSESHIDLSLASVNIGQYFQWTADDQIYGSDHYPTYLRVIPKNHGEGTESRWNLNRANWEKFQEEVNLRSIPRHIKDPNKLIQELTEKITNAAENTIPKKATPNRPLNSWWNKKCEEAKRERSRAHTNYKRKVNDDTRDVFLKACAETRRIFLEAKRESWKSYVDTINADTPTKTVWKKVNKIQARKIPNAITMLEVNGQRVENKKNS